MNNLEYKEIHSSEVFGRDMLGVKILVATSREIDLKSDPIYFATQVAAENIIEEIKAALITVNLESKQQAVTEKTLFLASFPEKIFVEEIPNGYCSKACCRHLPWFVVTTEIGRFKIGWRKRVIHLEWTETVGTKTAEELFPDENVTKWDKGIHAYDYTLAKKYIDIIFNNIDKTIPA